MPTPQERVEADIKEALKGGQKEKLQTLRMLLADVKNEKIRQGESVGEEDFLGLVKRGVKRRRDAAQQYRKGNRPELAAKEEREITYLEAYLPQAAGEAEIRAAIEELVAAQGLAGPAALGTVMKATMAKFGGRADGAVVNRIARELLGSSS